MKLRYLGSIMSILTAAFVLPACGDDDGGSSSEETDVETEEETEEATEETEEATEETEEATEETEEATEETEEETTDPDVTDPEETDPEVTDPELTDPEATDVEEPEPECDEPTEPEQPDFVEGCADPDDPEAPVEELSGEYAEDMTLTCETLWLLTDLTYITEDSTLSIEAGTTILGEEGSALVITNGSAIEAAGSAEQPIVMTSSAFAGERATGDWGGMVLLGDAPINTEGGVAQVEGIDPGEAGGLSDYGGDDDEHYCGYLQYVRVEFVGNEISPDNELNGISVAGCGSDTWFDYVQVHRGQDDGVEFWGGSARASHIVVSSTSDDSVDWDAGFQGSLQYVAIQQNTDSADNGFESDNNSDSPNAEPRSMPTIFNLTTVGAEITNGMVLRVGTWGMIYNAIITNYGVAIDVRDEESVAGTEEDPAALFVANSIFFDNGEDGETHFATEEGDDDDDAGFDEEAFFTMAALENQFDVDPDLGDATDTTGPDFVPADDSPAAEGYMVPPQDGFFECANYIGAFEPGGDDWTAGWTSYPEN